MTSATDELASRVVARDRRALAQAITLVESTRPDHREEAAQLLDALLPHTGHALRIGVSGAPGAGKSTFIEAFGLHVAGHGRRVAVLAVDPSSSQSGGSILGDKTRMEALSRDPNAYIRPSPSGGALGGVARRTREAMLVTEAAGFDVVVVETVGVGQSEIEVAGMVDAFMLLISPGGGDDLQGMKRGITELADIVIVTKADGDLLAPARQAAADYGHALHLMRRPHAGWEVPVLLCSARHGTGVAETWSTARALEKVLVESGQLAAIRRQQATEWLWREFTDSLVERVRDHPRLKTEASRLESAVAENSMSPLSAAQALLELAGS